MKNKRKHPEKISIGIVVNFQIDPNSIELSQKDLKKIYLELEKIKTEEFNSYESIQLDIDYAPTDKVDMVRGLLAYLDSIKLQTLVKRFVEQDKLNIIDAYNQGVAVYTKEYPIAFDSRNKIDTSDVYQRIDEIRKRIIIRLELYFLQKLMKKCRSNFILCVDEFKKEYLYNLPRKIQGVIFKHTSDRDLVRTLSSGLDLTIMISKESYQDNDLVVLDGPNNRIVSKPGKDEILEYKEQISQYTYTIGEQPSYADSKINLYVPLADTRFIEKAAYGDWYNGVAPFKTEYMYVTKGTIPTQEELDKRWFSTHSSRSSLFRR